MPAVYTKDYYATLGIKFPSSLPEIKAAYRKLAKFAHPDTGGTEEQMQALNEAYSVLADPVQKITYDLWYENSFVNRAKKEKQIIILFLLTVDHTRRTVSTKETTNIPPSFLKNFEKHIRKNGKLYVFQQKRKNGDLCIRAVSPADWYSIQAEMVSRFNKPNFNLFSSVFAFSRKKLESFVKATPAAKSLFCLTISIFTAFPLCFLGLSYLYLHGKVSAAKECLQVINEKTVNNTMALRGVYASIADLHNRIASATNIFIVICCVLLLLFIFFFWDYKRNKKSK